MTAAQALYRSARLSPDRRCRNRAARAAVRARARRASHDRRRRCRPGPAARRRACARIQDLRRSRRRAPLLFLHGTPGSRLKFAIGHDAGSRAGPGHRGAGPVGLRPQRCAGRADAAGVRRRHGGADGSPGPSPSSPSAASRAAGPYAAGVAACLRVARERRSRWSAHWAGRRSRDAGSRSPASTASASGAAALSPGDRRACLRCSARASTALAASRGATGDAARRAAATRP